jgi:hypothetical protein
VTAGRSPTRCSGGRSESTSSSTPPRRAERASSTVATTTSRTTAPRSTTGSWKPDCPAVPEARDRRAEGGAAGTDQGRHPGVPPDEGRRAKKALEEANALFPFVFSRAWMETRQDKGRFAVARALPPRPALSGARPCIRRARGDRPSTAPVRPSVGEAFRVISLIRSLGARHEIERVMAGSSATCRAAPAARGRHPAPTPCKLMARAARV